MCLGDNRRIVKFSSAEEGLPIDKVIKTAFCDVLGGEVEHISILIQIEERYGRGSPPHNPFRSQDKNRCSCSSHQKNTRRLCLHYLMTLRIHVYFHVLSALLISTPLYSFNCNRAIKTIHQNLWSNPDALDREDLTAYRSIV